MTDSPSSFPRVPAVTGAAGFRYQALAEQLHADLRRGRFPPGDRLPSIRSLCETYGASLATVTHALHRLEDAGLIEARARQGFFARLPSSSAVAHPADGGAQPRQALDTRRERLMALAASRADELSLGHLALPGDLLPESTLRRLCLQQLRAPAAALLEGSVAGSPDLRSAVASRLRRRGCQVEAGDVVVTHGQAEALQLCLRQTVRPGSRVAVTCPVPLRVLELLAAAEADVVELAPPGPAGGHGDEVVDALAAALRQGPLAACIADLATSAAAGTVWDEQACRALVALCGRHGLPVIECDLLGELGIAPEDLPLLKSFDAGDRVLHCGSTACVTGTGMSIGWVASGRHQLQLRAERAIHGELLPGLTDSVLAAFLASPAADRHLRRLRRQLSRRMKAWAAAVREAFPAGTGVRQGPAGHQLWVSLPDGDAVALLARARQQGISFVPGAVFTASRRFDHCLRLSGAHALDDRRLAALQSLGRLASEAAG